MIGAESAQDVLGRRQRQYYTLVLWLKVTASIGLPVLILGPRLKCASAGTIASAAHPPFCSEVLSQHEDRVAALGDAIFERQRQDED